MSVKIERYGSHFKEAISYILLREIQDSNLKFVSITDVDITNDLGFAKVYFTILDKNKKDIVLKSLNKAKSFIRMEIAKRVDIRKMPELIFVYDESIEHGEKIDKILDKLENN